MKLTPCTIAYLKRPKRIFKVKVLSDHQPYPAVTITFFQKEWIVKRDELMTAEEFKSQVIEKARKQLLPFIKAWNETPDSPNKYQAIGTLLNLPACAVWNMKKRCERLQLI